MNARERLAAAALWLGDNHEDLSDGLCNALDGLRLYDYAQAHDQLPEMADSWEPADRIAVLGYDPLDGVRFDAGTSGATEAIQALTSARVLLDSVAFVRTEGDTAPVIAAIDAVIAPA
ncbi:hypothetical protein [Cupriavidus sp. UYPR2.512]|uniref:hypothetical protein n=1 Tax=Cupriavidus sp. UYPR2.512 TaxID=1080187 RepID=UPI00037E787F|nr:hypothetical protein [Cupriavidus sp. UYPR2.512]UIF89284.1 hypothetical protein KAF44_30400 [Cupriavidus necator]